jgi:hypothetical protein
MGILDSLRDWRHRRSEQARAEAERLAQARGHLTSETIEEGERAADAPPKPGDLSPWER